MREIKYCCIKEDGQPSSSIDYQRVALKVRDLINYLVGGERDVAMVLTSYIPPATSVC